MTRPAPGARALRPVTPTELDTLTGWLRTITDAPPVERPMLAIRARADFKGWPCIVCETCHARNARANPTAVRHRMTISGVIDHYRRAFGYVHELAIATETIRVIA